MLLISLVSFNLARCPLLKPHKRMSWRWTEFEKVKFLNHAEHLWINLNKLSIIFISPATLVLAFNLVGDRREEVAIKGVHNRKQVVACYVSLRVIRKVPQNLRALLCSWEDKLDRNIVSVLNIDLQKFEVLESKFFTTKYLREKLRGAVADWREE